MPRTKTTTPKWELTSAGKIALVVIPLILIFVLSFLLYRIAMNGATITRLQHELNYYRQCSLEDVLCEGEEINIEITPRGDTMPVPKTNGTNYDTFNT